MQDSYSAALTCHAPTHIYILIHGPTLSFSFQGFPNLITQSHVTFLIHSLSLSSLPLRSSLKRLLALEMRSSLLYQKGQKSLLPSL
jgi:hypothetical protein